MTNKKKLKNLLMQQLKNDTNNQNLLAMLKGTPLQGKLSEGQLMILVMFLPIRRHKELLSYELPFEGWYGLWGAGTMSTSSRNPFFKKMRNTSQGFAEKLRVLSCMDKISETNFQEVFVLIEDADDCLMLLEEVEEKKQITACLDRLTSFEPSINNWGEVEEMAHQFNYAQYVRMTAMKGMITIAQATSTPENWLKVYTHCLSGSNHEKEVLKEISNLHMDFDDWFDKYNNPNHRRVAELALQNMQILKGCLGDWINILDNPGDFISGEKVRAICLSMIQKLEWKPKECYNACYALEEDTLKVDVLLKMLK